MYRLPEAARRSLEQADVTQTGLGLKVLPDGRWTPVASNLGLKVLPDGSWKPVASKATDVKNAPDIVAKVIQQSVYLWTVPRSLRIRRNPYRQADEISASIRFSDLPIDPRVVRSLGIAAYMGTVPADAWAQRMAGGVAVSDDARRNAAYSLTDLIDRKNLRFVGFADEAAMSFSEGGDYVNIQGRDFTQLLIDYPVPQNLFRSINWGEWPIDKIVWEILQTLPSVAGVPLHLLGFEQGTIWYERAGHHYAGEPKTTASGRAVRNRRIEQETYWDMLTDITVGMGLVLYADVWTPNEGEGKGIPTGRFVLATPRELYSNLDKPRSFTEYDPSRSARRLMQEPAFASKGRQYSDGKTLTHPVMVYGHNLKSMELNRRLGKIKIPAVELVCSDPDNGKTLRGQWPAKAQPQPNSARYLKDTMAGYVHPTGLWAKEEIRQYPVTGFTTQDALIDAAKQVFEDLGRGDLTLKFETLDMASFGGDNSDPDLLSLKPGSPLEIVTAYQKDGEVVGSREMLAGMDQEQLRNWLLAKGQSKEAATSLAVTMASPQYRNLLERRYYVKQCELSMDNEDGFSCSVEAVNYLTSRVLQFSQG